MKYSNTVEYSSVNMDHPEFISAALCLLIIFDFTLESLDTLLPNETLSDGDVLISPGQMFKLGFFTPGKSTFRYLGIWYIATPDVVVWLANRNDPIVDSTGVLTLAQNGTLVLSSAHKPRIWNSDSSMPATNPALRLLVTGNLALVDDSRVIWQSFDHPTDSTYPGMGIEEDPDTGTRRNLTSWRSADDPSSGEYVHRIENRGLSQMIFTRGDRKTMRFVFWNGFFTELPDIQDAAWKTEVVTKRGRLMSASRPFNEAINIRMTMNYTGKFQHYTMNERKDGWILIFTLPRDTCDNYGHCGNNGICRVYKTPVCECLWGFIPKAEKEWRMFVTPQFS